MKSNEIRNFISLMESIDDKIIQNTIINEANPLGIAAREGKFAAKEIESVYKTLKLRGSASAKLFAKAGVKNADDFLKLIKNDFVSMDKASTKLPKLLPKEAQQLRGSFELGILKSNSTNAKLLDIAADNLAKDGRFIEKYKAVGSETDLVNKLKQNGYSDQGAKAIAKKRTFYKNNPIKKKPDPTKPNPNPKPTPPRPKWWDQLIIWLKKKKSWKEILAWGIGLSIPAAILYNAVLDSGEPLPSDIEEPKIDDSWAPCIQDLLKSKQGVLNTNKDGSVSVLVKSTEYPAGLMFYSNGRVFNIQTKQKGSWSCKNSKPTIQESRKMSLMGIINEQGDDIAGDVDKMIDYLDFPVSYNNLVNAKTLLSNYSKNGKGKEFLELYQQSGLGGGSLGKSLKYIATTEPKSVQAKNQLIKLYDEIRSGKVTNTETTNTAGLGNINITWDGNPTPPTPDPDPNPNPKPKYKDCSSIDINKQGIEFGCKHPIVKKIQECIFKDKPEYQTGNFGPKTMEKVGGNLITKEFYDKTMANCGSSSNVTTSDVINAGGGNNFPGIRNKVDASRFDYLNNPSSENPTSDQGSSSNSTVTSASTNESPEEFYNRLNNEGLLTGDVGETVVTDANGVQTRYPPTKRIKYKGPDLSAERLQQLDTILGGFSPSYRRIKQKVKGEDMKYVWLQVKTKRKNKK